MNDRILDHVPEHLREAVRVALSTVFGQVPIENHQLMSGGASGALAFRIDAPSGPYVLRLEVRRHPLRNPHQYKCMQLAADAGIAPPLRYASEEAGVAIMDHIAERPLHLYPGGTAMLARDSAALIARLHAIGLFPPVGDFRQLVRRLLAHLRSGFSAGLLDAHEENFERIVAAYPWNVAAHVSSHNDPNPRNTLFDGNRLWLIDWETAYRNDALLDVAILAEHHAPCAEETRTLLHAYLGRPPEPAQLAQLRLMRQLTRLYYAGLLLSTAMISPAPIESLAAPTPDGFRTLLAAGKLVPGSRETKVILGKMYLSSFVSELDAPGYEESLASASQLG